VHFFASQIPHLSVVTASSVPVERVSDYTYQSLDFESSRGGGSQSLTAQSLSSRGLSAQPTPSTAVDRALAVSVETLTVSPDTSPPRALGVQLGLFHGTKRLCPLHTAVVRCAADDGGVIHIQQVLNVI